LFAAAGLAWLSTTATSVTAPGPPRQLLDLRRQYEDWDAALAHAQHLDCVDPDRVALWATSFSGGHVLAAAARHLREVAAVVSQTPWLDGSALSKLRLNDASSASTTRSCFQGSSAAVCDAWAAHRGGPPVAVPVTGPPGSYAT